jgi:hypothetical protein
MDCFVAFGGKAYAPTRRTGRPSEPHVFHIFGICGILGSLKFRYCNFALPLVTACCSASTDS